MTTTFPAEVSVQKSVLDVPAILDDDTAAMPVIEPAGKLATEKLDSTEALRQECLSHANELLRRSVYAKDNLCYGVSNQQHARNRKLLVNLTEQLPVLIKYLENSVKPSRNSFFGQFLDEAKTNLAKLEPILDSSISVMVAVTEAKAKNLGFVDLAQMIQYGQALEAEDFDTVIAIAHAADSRLKSSSDYQGAQRIAGLLDDTYTGGGEQALANSSEHVPKELLNEISIEISDYLIAPVRARVNAENEVRQAQGNPFLVEQTLRVRTGIPGSGKSSSFSPEMSTAISQGRLPRDLPPNMISVDASLRVEIDIDLMRPLAWFMLAQRNIEPFASQPFHDDDQEDDQAKINAINSFAKQITKKVFEQACQAKIPVLLHENGKDFDILSELLTIAQEQGYKSAVEIIDAPLALCWKRSVNRIRGIPPLKQLRAITAYATVLRLIQLTTSQGHPLTESVMLIDNSTQIPSWTDLQRQVSQEPQHPSIERWQKYLGILERLDSATQAS